jgi:hypothetical protein
MSRRKYTTRFEVITTNFHSPNLLPTIGQKGYLSYYIFSTSEDSHTIRSNRPAPFFHPPEQTTAALYTQYCTLCTLDLLS